MRRLTALVLVAALVALLLVMTIGPAHARELIGCDGVVRWPCPGPVL